MTNQNLSVEAFKGFLETLMSLNIMKEATARNLKNSSARLLTVVKEDEMDDVTHLNVNVLADRYIEITEPKPSESSITAYKSRMESAIKKFVAYQAGEEIPYTPIDKESSEDTDLIGEPTKVEGKVHTLHTYDLPVVLRPESGITITIKGIPSDITNEEAERIASILKVYVRPH
ncbi:hypothetical protein ACLF4E_004351 [Cronobacter malonaticus]